MSVDQEEEPGDVRRALEEARREVNSLRHRIRDLSGNSDRRKVSTLIGEIGKGYRDTIKWGVIGYGFWCAWKSIAAVAGKTTDFSFLVDVPFVEVTLPFLSYLPFILAIVVLIRVKNGWKKEHEKLIAKYSTYQQSAELESDPNRSSSMLTHDGRTRPGDE